MSKRFRVALSFSSDKRNYVEAVADILSKHFGKDAILYDIYHEAELARADLAFYLPRLYKEEADLVVVVFCKDYSAKDWCGLEWRAVFSLLKEKDDLSLLLSRFDFIEPNELHGLAGFTDLDEKTPRQFADLILGRLAINEGKSRDYYTKSIQNDIDKLRSQSVRHNLPKRSYHKLIGRQKDLQELKKRISFDEFYERIITLIGIGGVGKTTLALEAAYSYIDTQDGCNMFDLIVFATAQKNSLSPKGITEINDSSPVRTLRGLCLDIARVSDQFALRQEHPYKLVYKLHQFLSSGIYMTLIILDNLEEIEDADTREILEFFKTVKSSKIKVIITTRKSDHYDLNLLHLDAEEAMELINSLLARYNLFATDEFKNRLQLLSGGIPLAIVYSIGILSLKSDPKLALDMLIDPQGDLAAYCFEKLFFILKQDHPLSYRLLLALSLTPYGFTRSILFDIYKIRQSEINSASDSLGQLCRCSLVYQENDFYRLLPLTRYYVLGKLENDFDLSRRVYECLVNVYVDIARINGGEDQGEWHRKYDVLNKEWGNFRCIVESCLSEGDFENAKLLWQSLCRFTYLYAYWTDREIWTDCLMHLSTQRSDNRFLAELMSAKAWIAILRETDENLRHAKDLLTNAWTIKQYCSPYIRCTIALNLAIYYARTEQFEKADYWFIQQHKKAVKDYRHLMRDYEYKRLELRFLLYFAERFYRNMNNNTAYKIYLQVVKKADAINWLRFKVKAFERLAYLQIKERNFKDAREILDTWYPVMERNHDVRRMAFFQRDYAELEFQLQNFAESSRWARMAMEIFSDLGMENRSNAMQKYINS